MDLIQNYLKLLTSKGLGAKHASVLDPYIAVMTIPEFEPHSRFHS